LTLDKVDLSIPKFEFSTEIELTYCLQRMGMVSAFDSSSADFSGITKSVDLAVSKVLHKAFIQIDERGTEVRFEFSSLINDVLELIAYKHRLQQQLLWLWFPVHL